MHELLVDCNICRKQLDLLAMAIDDNDDGDNNFNIGIATV